MEQNTKDFLRKIILKDSGHLLIKVINTKVIGKGVKSMAEESIFLPMATSMMESIAKTKDMGQEHILLTRMK